MDTFCAPCVTRRPASHLYYGTTKSLCSTCKRSVDAKIHFEDDKVWFHKYCPEHGHERRQVCSSVEWYLDALSFVSPNTPPRGERKPVKGGCPFDCGPCTSHQQKVYLPVIPITSACNLDCPICYTINKNDDPHMLSKESFAKILGHLKDQHDELDIINFTGGEPTMHPELVELLRMSRAAGIRRLTISTNGIRLRDEKFVKELADVDARIVLSLDTFREDVDQVLLGARTVKLKLEVLDHLEKHDVTTTILPAVASGLNDADVGPLFDLMLKKPNVCSLELHTMTFTGQGGVEFSKGNDVERSARISIPDLQNILRDHTGGRIEPKDFVPSPLAHPHCYSICYVLMLDGGGFVPFTRFLGRAKLYDLLSESIYIQPREKIETMLREAIDDLWADPESCVEGERVLATLRGLIDRMFPPGGQLSLEERQKIAERASKAIYIHSHMDEETFDVARIMKCSVGVPEEDGSNIPTCAYNILYREKDTRFADPVALKERRALPIVR